MQNNASPRHSFGGGNAVPLPTLSGPDFRCFALQNLTPDRRPHPAPGDQKIRKIFFANAACEDRAGLATVNHDL
jgi:hypothetical protein